MRRPSIGELRRLNLIMGSKLKLMSDYPDAKSIMFSLSPPPRKASHPRIFVSVIAVAYLLVEVRS